MANVNVHRAPIPLLNARHAVLNVSDGDNPVRFYVDVKIDVESGGSADLLADHLRQFLDDVTRVFPTLNFQVVVDVDDSESSKHWDVV